MAQRLGEVQRVSRMSIPNSVISTLNSEARRLDRQIFLSVDLPTSFGNPGQASHTILHAEKLLVKSLVDLGAEGQSSDS